MDLKMLANTTGAGEIYCENDFFFFLSNIWDF